MTKKKWLKGAALLVIAVLMLTGCNRKTEAQEGDSGRSSAPAVPAVQVAPASDFSYELTDDRQGVRIVGYTGEGGVVIIPATIEGMPVTVIGRAFRDNFNITEIVLPEGVTTITGNAFRNMENLSKATLPDSLRIIHAGAFMGNRNLTTVNLPASLEEIGDSAFRDCGELNNMTIPDSIDKVTFPGGALHGDNNAFRGCGKLPLATRARIEAIGYTGRF